ncbi:MAG: hypothetical protein OEZ32_08200 [Nitrospinota bacterium]|nr:hypothetical protein [Nitrospinota bacterium]
MEKTDLLSGKKAGKLTGEQKEKIALVRNKAEAKKAETQIMMDDRLKKMAPTGSAPEEMEKIRREFMDQIDKIDRDTEAEVEKIKEG